MDVKADPQTDPARERSARLFQFIAALFERRHPPARSISGEPWQLRVAGLPDHPLISYRPQAEDAEPESESDSEILLKVCRPELIPPPQAPAELDGWLTPEWNDCKSEPQVREAQSDFDETGEPRIVTFVESNERTEALTTYRALWDVWARDEKIALATREVFDKLYELHGTLQREGEEYELVVGDGLLVWRRPEGGVRYPILSKRVNLEFSPEIPEFRISDSTQQTELYSALFRSMKDVDGRVIARLRDEADALALHPLDDQVTGFLRSFAASISSNGHFEEKTPSIERDEPVVSRYPVFFMRKRSGGFVNAIANIVEDILNGGDIPPALTNIVGIAEEILEENSGGDGESSVNIVDANEDETVLFTKPANREQLNIAQTLMRNSCVLVQGPPGTGKTHTIANLLGHLLAQGKSVLVTSHTTKALKVLRDKVVDQLQPLCLCVLDDSASDNDRLKSSIEGIVERLGTSDEAKLDRQIIEATLGRADTLQRIQTLRQNLLKARTNEQRAIVVGGETFTPIEAAKYVSEGKDTLSWIPGPLSAGAAVPLTPGEATTLFATNSTVTALDERLLGGWLPSLDGLPSPGTFDSMTSELESQERLDLEFRSEYWHDPGNGEISDLDDAVKGLIDAAALIRDQPGWVGRIADAAQQGDAAVWQQLMSDVAVVNQTRIAGNELSLQHNPTLPTQVDLQALADTLGSLANEVLARGKPPGFLALLTNKQWKLAIEACTVGGRKPTTAEHFEALAQCARLAVARERLRDRWLRQFAPLEGPDATAFGTDVEVAAKRFVPLIELALNWKNTSWNAAVARLRDAGLKWDDVEKAGAIQFPELPAIDMLFAVSAKLIPDIAVAERFRRRQREITRQIEAMKAITLPRSGASSVAISLDQSIAALNAGMYRSCYDEIARLSAVYAASKERSRLIEKVRVSAENWAAAFESRVGKCGAGQAPSDVRAAWLWSQFTEELERRDKLSADDISRELETARIDLRRITAALVDVRAWRSQISRTSLRQRQALMGFAKAKQRIGKGTGKRAPAFARLARESMTEAQSAVPVWIMPLVRVAEMYDPRKTKFDVVILDEASQSDVTGLFAFYLGKQVIVVGDDEQVSPSAVGEKVDETAHLIDELLQGIPNAPLYGGQLSLYDLAKQSFGGTIALREHFRCVPEIIAFSNGLSYNGSIKPLRELLPGDIRPSVIAHRVDSGDVVMGVNEREAREVAALIASCIERPEYHGKTFGVVSMVGEHQARRIEEIVRAVVDPAEIESRKLLVGNPAQFQGDERNIMFLSLVDAADGGPKSMRQEHRFQQRFNVAASRGQDQMWVVHSLDPATDLQAGDLRRRLIEHALDPGASLRVEAKALDRAESVFEKDVIKRLSGAGYGLRAQYSVGAYRIDLVVEGDDGRRVAFECDGDRFHGAAELDNDLERQAVLERLGWTFVRLRGTQFYRDPEGSMAWAASRLSALGIYPGRAVSVQVNESENIQQVKHRAAEILAELDAGVIPVMRQSRGRRKNPASG